MKIPAEFDEIRPYTEDELPAIYEELLADPDFINAVALVLPEVSTDALATQMRGCKNSLEFQKAFCYPILKKLAQEQGNGMEMDSSVLNMDRRYTFISNHRDIILDSAFLCVLLIDNGFPTTEEIAIGDNLLIHPWIERLVRINKSFIVQRALTMRHILLSSTRMSRYMHFAVNEKKENIWMAQREGRAKDSNDRTQESVLKMICMGGNGSIIDRLKDMHIVPLSISYEYDPCDSLKAKEFQQKRDNPNFKKSGQDDLTNMNTGIFGFKGHIHYQCAPCIDEWLDTLDPETNRAELFTTIATHIDHEIHIGYCLYPGNYVAYDLLNGSEEMANHYTIEQQKTFKDYVDKQIEKISFEHKDYPFLRERVLTMYANPVKNQMAANNK